MSEAKLLEEAKALQARKQYIFEQLTRISDATTGKLSETDAEVYLRSCNKFDAFFEKLIEEIIVLNTKLGKSDQIKMSDSSTIHSLIDTICKRCLKSKSKQSSEESGVRQVSTTLPTLSLPVWDGDISSWTSFKAQFDSIVHVSHLLSGTAKLQHLRSCLRGEPLSIVDQHPLTDESYELAYQELTARYQNKRRIASFYVNKILDYKTGSHPTEKEHSRFIEIHRAAAAELRRLEIPNLSEYLLFELGYQNLTSRDQERFDFEYNSDIPEIKDLLAFVERIARTKELRIDKKSITTERQGCKAQMIRKALVITKGSYHCFFCQGDHMLFRCPEILALPVAERRSKIKQLGCCIACLYKHAGKCKSKYACKMCGSKVHNTILHENKTAASSSKSLPTPLSLPSSNSKTCNNCLSSNINPPVLLGTILCRVQDSWGESILVRAVLDPGSEISIVSSSLADRLGLAKSPSHCQVQGIGGSVTKTQGSVRIKINSVNSSVTYEFVAVILPRICDQIPKSRLSSAMKERFNTLELADPDFHLPNNIQILLGAGAFADLLSSEEPVVIRGEPTAVRTKFGYVITGRAYDEKGDSHLVSAKSFHVTTTSLEDSIRRFWEVEEMTSEIMHDPNDVACERHFQDTHTRDSSGRFVVRLPFIPDAPPLGNNKEIVMKRLRNLERRLKGNSVLDKAYRECLDEYLTLGHISPYQGDASYLLPHHAVVKASSSTTKCRVVFDCSALDDQGLSLNDRLLRGPPLLNDIGLLINKFRMFAVCLVGDIKMMYRMVSIHPDDRRHLIIAWNNKQYQMNRLPFGLKPAGYLAGRCLIELANLYEKEFPMAAQAIKNHRYADDFCIGGDTVEEAKLLREELTKLLAKGGFEIRRWSSNNPDTLLDIPDAFRETPTRLPSGDVGVKVLGVMWDQLHDAFVARVVRFDSEITSKRTVFSYIAKIYDVMGFFSPTIFLAKHFMQRLWLLRIEWDQPLPEELEREWNDFTTDLVNLTDIKIPRFIPVAASKIRLVGFSDASERGMAAAIYIQWTYDGNLGQSRLIMAKTKLAPLKTLTIPRLELCAALLLARIMKLCIDCSDAKFESINLYTDSTIVLAWLKYPLHELKIFVANRVAEIQTAVPSAVWGHVCSRENPADLGSRGIPSTELKGSELWWHGPEFLSLPFLEWPGDPYNPCTPDQLPEIKESMALNILLTEPKDQIIRRFSSLTKMKRVLAYVFRYINKIKKKSDISLLTGTLSCQELENALLTAVRLSQMEEFGTDYDRIREGKLPNKQLQKLSPFFDVENRLIRVGGRLGRASFLPKDARHPFLLSKKGHLSSLLCDHFHYLYLHSGPRTTCAAIQRKFWIPSVMSLVKKRIHNCLVCRRYDGRPQQPLMADVLPERMDQTYCWTNCAVDFGGPFTVRESNLRKSTTHKVYICLFVCLTTRAIHIEMVTDLTSAAFIAAFHRFISRRAVPATIYSDRGTNFVGARTQLYECMEFLRKNHDKLLEAAATVGTRWLLNAPYGPNFNGCAENGIKSAKSLIKRQMGEQVLTFEEFLTLLCRVEQILNSRPISFSSLDVKDRDVVYLTPGHFITGREMTTAPEQIFEDNCTPRDRWKRVQRMAQEFWKTWSVAYLHELMQRTKWEKRISNLQANDIVYVTGVKTSPLSWPIGRVLETFTNSEDKTVRVARIRVRGHDVVRPVNKLIRIPTQ